MVRVVITLLRLRAFCFELAQGSRRLDTTREPPLENESIVDCLLCIKLLQ